MNFAVRRRVVTRNPITGRVQNVATTPWKRPTDISTSSQRLRAAQSRCAARACREPRRVPELRLVPLEPAHAIARAHALGAELFGSPRALPAFPFDKSIRGIRYERLARPTRRSLQSTSTTPTPSITASRAWTSPTCRTRSPVATIFPSRPPVPSTSRRGFSTAPSPAEQPAPAKGRGVFILTVPFLETGATREHFPPALYEFRIVEEGDRRVLDTGWWRASRSASTI